MQHKYTLYYKIKDNIKEDILNGIYTLGSLLPTENEFEKQYKVSKITIRKAIELLEQDGYVKKKSGFGTTVISNSIYNKLSKGSSFTNILQQQNLLLTKKHHPMKKVKFEKDEELYQYFGGNAVLVERSYLLDGKPYIFMKHYLPKQVNLATNIDDNLFSIYMFLYHNNFIINCFEDFFFVTTAPKNIVDTLAIKENTPLLGRKRITYDESGKIIEVSIGYYNSDVHPYQINYQI